MVKLENETLKSNNIDLEYAIVQMKSKLEYDCEVDNKNF